MQDAIQKADILIEALPYIKEFQRKIIVIKYGGSTMQQSEEAYNILKDIVFMHVVGMRPVIVHGGGYLISERMRSLKQKPEFIDGFRKTDEEAMEVVAAVLTEVNSKIVDDIQSLGGKAKPLTHDKESIVCATMLKKELGYAGKVESINVSPLKKILSKGTIPVISPVGINSEGHAMNVNADDAATAIAEALKAEKLILMTNVRGVLANAEDDQSLYSTLTVEEAAQLLERKIIQGGMIPKINAAIHAVRAGVQKVHIIDGGIPRSLLLEIFTNQGIGTQIVP